MAKYAIPDRYSFAKKQQKGKRLPVFRATQCWQAYLFRKVFLHMSRVIFLHMSFNLPGLLQTPIESKS